MRVLITGGAGFLGTNLALHLAKKGHKVTVFDNLQRTQKNAVFLEQEEIPLVKGELEDLNHTLKDASFDVIYHFAAQVAVTSSYQNPYTDFRINAFGTFNVASLAKMHNVPIIYASTNKVYGDSLDKVPIKEEETRYEYADKNFHKKGIPETHTIDARKHTPYGISKLVGELYVREYGGVANRFSCMYGPHQHGNEDQGWLSHFLRLKLAGKSINIYGTGKQVRDALYAGDVVRLLEAQGEKIKEIPGEVFNIGGGYENTVSLIELAKIIDHLNELDYFEWRPADQKVYYSDISKANKLLNWSPRVNKHEGVKKTMDWIEENLSEVKVH